MTSFESPQVIKDKHGFWEMTLLSPESLVLSFKVPSERTLCFARRARLVLLVIYTCGVLYGCRGLGLHLSTLAVAAVYFLPFIFVAMLRRGPHGGKRFIPYLIAIDGPRQVVEMTDLRGGYAPMSRGFNEIAAVYFDRGISRFAPPDRIVFSFMDDTEIRLPAAGFYPELLLTPLYERLPRSVLQCEPEN